MANASLFASLPGRFLPPADAKNHHRAPAYAFSPRHKLAQLAATGALNETYYTDARAQLDDVLQAAKQVDPAFIAKTAIYARQRGAMKDMPALLAAVLTISPGDELTAAFGRVIDNGKMLRNFVQIMRSGAVGRKSLGTRPKRLVRHWLETASDQEILRAAVGQNPSLADVIKMVHPKPATPEREALFGYLVGRAHDAALLPAAVRDFEAFKLDPRLPLPDVPFQMLTALPLTREHWAAIGLQGGWHMARMNLNSFARHGAFEVEGFAQSLAARLRDEQAIRKARVFPYQLLAAYVAASQEIPHVVREALQDAMEISIANAPALPGKVVVCPDVSGSMDSPVTGRRQGATSTVRCIDVAALVSAALLRKNPTARVLPFEHKVVDLGLNVRDSVMTNAAKLAAVGGGGTYCAAPLLQLLAEKAQVDLVVFVSDNESWMDAYSGRQGATATMTAWNKLKALNPNARLVCIDIQPNATTQVVEREDILNVGGFSDAVFDVMAAFVKGELNANHWVGEIDKIELHPS